MGRQIDLPLHDDPQQLKLRFAEFEATLQQLKQEDLAQWKQNEKSSGLVITSERPYTTKRPRNQAKQNPTTL